MIGEIGKLRFLPTLTALAKDSDAAVRRNSLEARDKITRSKTAALPSVQENPSAS